MNKNFIIECIDIIDQIKLHSIVGITKYNEELRYQVVYNKENENYELLCLDEENAIWDDGETIKDIKELLACDSIVNRYEKIRLIEEE